MDRELQKALNRLVPKPSGIWATQADAETIVEAARKVANLDPKPFARYERLGGLSLESCDPADADVWIVDVADLGIEGGS